MIQKFKSRLVYDHPNRNLVMIDFHEDSLSFQNTNEFATITNRYPDGFSSADSFKFQHWVIDTNDVKRCEIMICVRKSD